MTIPAYLPYYVITGSFGIIAAILLGLRDSLIKADWSTHERDRTIRTVSAGIIGWFVVAVMLALLGAYHAASDRIPTIQYGIFVPIIIGVLLFYRSPTVRRLIGVVPQHWLVGIQVYRALGVIFLILYASGKLPGLFAWPAGLGDMLVGIFAPFVALAYARGPRENRDWIYAWNIFGLVDLAVAVGMGFMTSPSSLQRFAFYLPNELITMFPLVLIPTFLVPVSVMLYLASLSKLTVDDQVKQGVEKTGGHLPGRSSKF
ncbi:hypothetical protein [Methylocaldum sp.]|uniref:hypothetical protein n=1 Tax=Methylocaldum sp. TaxID=1969727 RepID=UPI002D2BD25A|nr:hypothetical protein [Methylocaldum sp.]HYE37322.1 hypothetical protein [Methylocaldum sp.]